MPTYSEILNSEIDAESPITVSLMTRLRDNALSYLGAPSGTKLICRSTPAPLGWTVDTTFSDRALRLTNGSISQGGSVAFSTVFGRTNTDAFTIQQTNLPGVSFTLVGSVSISDPQHAHPGPPAAPTKAVQEGSGNAFTAFVASTPTGSSGVFPGTPIAATGISASMSGVAQSGGANTAIAPAIDLRVAYADVTIITKS